MATPQSSREEREQGAWQKDSAKLNLFLYNDILKI